MPRMLSITTIRSRIAALEAKAKKLETATKPGVEQITKLIRKFKLSRADLRDAFKGQGRGRTSSLRGKKAPVKYRDTKGNKWSGRGRTPKWLVAAEKAGAKRGSFLIGK